MTTFVKSTCPTCGEVEFGTEVVRLQVCRDRRQSYYRFVCPGCSEDVYRPADDHAIHLLGHGGVVAHMWDVPDELLEEPHPGPLLTLDYAIDLHADVEAFSAGVSS